MAIKAIPRDPRLVDMTVEVMQKVREQQYTPELLCQMQSVLDTQHYYWWCMDMKKEEYAIDLFAKDFSYYCFGPQTVTAEQQAMRSKRVNELLATSHMGHQPMIWLIDESHARGVFQYEDHHLYTDDGALVQGWAVYINDFIKCEDGKWRISDLRLMYHKMDGKFRRTEV